MADLILKNGSFYREGIKVPLEFGNKEQIRLIDAAKQLKDEGALPDFIFDQRDKIIGLTITCVCGSTIHCSLDSDKGDDVVGDIIQCSGCLFMYEVCEDEYGFKFFKLLEPKKKRKEASRG